MIQKRRGMLLCSSERHPYLPSELELQNYRTNIKSRPTTVYVDNLNSSNHGLISPNPLQFPVNLLMLFQEQERRNRMRSQSYKTRYPSSKHPPYALHPINIGQESRQPLTITRAHNPRLNNIHRTTYRSSHKTSHKTRSEMRRQTVLHRSILNKEPFEAIVRSQLTRSHKHRTHGIWPYSTKERFPALLPRHAYQPINSILIIPPLRFR